MVPGPCACAGGGGSRLRKVGEDVSGTLGSIPRQWKVIQHVREKFSCRDCEAVSQSPAPFHVVPRGWAGPSLLAMVLFEKFGQHQPLNRQAERYAREVSGDLRRSEEHTSELQSLMRISYAVFCLKKKTTKRTI